MKKIAIEKIILFSKSHGNHKPENANLSIYEIFETYNEAKNYLKNHLTELFNNTSTEMSIEEFIEENNNYWAIYEHGDNSYVDKVFFNEEEF